MYPEDFGIIAIALLVMGLFETIQQFEGGAYLMRSKEINDSMVNTSWTIGLIMSVILALALYLSIPLVVDYYEDPRLEAVLTIYSTLLIVRYFGNPATVYLRRSQNYLPLIKVTFTAKLLSVILAVGTAVTYKNYWALIIGQYSASLFSAIGSYREITILFPEFA